MSQITTPTELNDAMDEATAHPIPVDQRGPTDQRRATVLNKIWDRAPLYNENEKDVPLECPDADELPQEKLESTYSRAVTRFMRRRILPALQKKSDGGDDVLLSVLDVLSDLTKTTAKEEAAKSKKDGHLLEHSEAITTAVKTISAERDALKARIDQAIDDVITAMEVGFDCTDVNFDGMNINAWMSNVMAVNAGKAAGRREAAARASKK